jgi:hypothetical protein
VAFLSKDGHLNEQKYWQSEYVLSLTINFSIFKSPSFPLAGVGNLITSAVNHVLTGFITVTEIVILYAYAKIFYSGRNAFLLAIHVGNFKRPVYSRKGTALH